MSDPKHPTIGVDIHLDDGTIITSHSLDTGNRTIEVINIGAWVDIFVQNEVQMRALTSAIEQARMRMYRRSNLVLARQWEQSERAFRPDSMPESLSDDEVLSRYHNHREHMSAD